jgi:hypothetical protein
MEARKYFGEHGSKFFVDGEIAVNEYGEQVRFDRTFDKPRFYFFDEEGDEVGWEEAEPEPERGEQ